MIVVESLMGFVLVYVFHALPMWLLLSVFLSVLIPNIIVNLLLVFDASRLIQDIGLFFLAFFTVLSLTAIIHYFPEARPSFLLAYVPAIIFTSSQSLSYGITNLILVLFCYGSLTYLEINGYKLLLSQPVNYAAMSNAWKAGTAVTFLFLLILSFMSFYFSQILRKRATKIAHLAEINKKLYQKSKTTSDEIISSMREALVVVDNNLKIVQYNKAFRALVGHEAALTNEKIKSLNIEFIKFISQYLDGLNRDNQGEKNLQFKVKDKSFREYNVNISVIELQNKESGYIILIDESTLPWGTIYDSKNGKPVDLALIRLISVENNKVIETKVSDHDGRFGFIIQPGKYSISVSKENFVFPSKLDKSGYHGEKINVSSALESLIKINIPIDETDGSDEPEKSEISEKSE